MPPQIGTGIKHHILVKGRLKAKVSNIEGQLSSWADVEGHIGGHGPKEKGGRENCRFICRSFPIGTKYREKNRENANEKSLQSMPT